VIAFAGEGHFVPAALASNTFDIEWPPRSGRRQNFPEVDRAEWFDIEVARTFPAFSFASLPWSSSSVLWLKPVPTWPM
jgi:predicted NUDIX family NTP pyrophosphohydrolase